jgi:hypothetical protein
VVEVWGFKGNESEDNDKLTLIFLNRSMWKFNIPDPQIVSFSTFWTQKNHAPADLLLTSHTHPNQAS